MTDQKLPAPLFTPPPAEEMALRITRLRAAMDEAGLDYLVAFDPDNIFYLTNFANYVHERPFIVVLGKDGPLKFLAPKLEVPHVRSRMVGQIEITEYFEFPAPQGENWFDRFAELFGADARVGVEPDCPLHIFQAVPGQPTGSPIIEDVRMVKSDYEIARIIYASNLATQTQNHVLENAKAGQTLVEVGSQVRAIMLMQVLADYPETNMLATNVTGVFQPPSISHDPHNFTNVNVAMEEGGPHVSLINGTMNGYGTEVERTFFIGHVPDKARRPFDTMMAARQLAFDLIKPGANMGEVDEAVNTLLKQAGYGDNLLHRTGHSIGVTGHEGPFLAQGYDREIKPGMIFTIEPGIYLEGIGGFRHSDTVLVTADGCVSLTPSPSSLEEMTIPSH